MAVAAPSRGLVGALSGGERNRVHLAKVLQSGGSVLLLDEPTNDLDVDTLRALEAGLESFPGCEIVISHDRWIGRVDRKAGRRNPRITEMRARTLPPGRSRGGRLAAMSGGAIYTYVRCAD